jgi:2'-5' RNA ligase
VTADDDRGSPPDQVRAFVAFPVGEALAGAIAALRDRLRPRLAGLRWVRPDGLHFTLRFLGRSTRVQLEGLVVRLAAGASACPRAEARTGGLGLFPERGSPRVLWLDVAVPPSVLALQSACEAAAVAEGFAPEPRPFRSHLTLGRWRDRAPRPSLPEVDEGVLPLRDLVLFRSQIRPGGAVYTELARFPLKAEE